MSVNPTQKPDDDEPVSADLQAQIDVQQVIVQGMRATFAANVDELAKRLPEGPAKAEVLRKLKAYRGGGA